MGAGTSSSGDGIGAAALVSLRAARGGMSAACMVAPRAVLSQREEASDSVRAQSSTFTEPLGRSFQSAEQRVHEAVAKQVAIVEREQNHARQTSLVDVRPDLTPVSTLDMLEEAYARCGEVCAEYAKTFYLGTHCYPSSLHLLTCSLSTIATDGSCSMADTQLRLCLLSIGFQLCASELEPHCSHSSVAKAHISMICGFLFHRDQADDS